MKKPTVLRILRRDIIFIMSYDLKDWLGICSEGNSEVCKRSRANLVIYTARVEKWFIAEFLCQQTEQQLITLEVWEPAKENETRTNF